MYKRKIQVFVFDLDFTLWNAGDTFCSETNPPYLWEEGKLLDRSGRWMRLYPDTLEILNTLQSIDNIIIASASRTEIPGNAMQLMEVFDIGKYFNIKEIYPGSKIEHMKRIQEQVNCPFDQIVFFDDELRNIEIVSALGAKCVLVENGISLNLVNEYI